LGATPATTVAADLPRLEEEARAAAGEPHVVRLRTPDEGDTAFDDLLRGEVRIPNAEIRDTVLLKSDGFPTYHLAVVVDDHLMGVTHVMRAEEWVTSTPIHVLLYRAFGWPLPTFVHLPLLRNPDANKTKISKRKMDTSVESYREQGILPEALLNFLGTMGWSMPDGRELFSLDEMIAAFDLGAHLARRSRSSTSSGCATSTRATCATC
jgi:glutamyl-tRNA synthetase